MLIKTRGIVLRTIKYSETSLITDVYTEAKGLQTYLVSGVRKRGARVKPSLLQVMSLLELVAYFREGKSSIRRIRELRPAYVYQAVPFDIRRSAVGQFLTEVARRTLHEPEENPELFRFLFETYRWLDRTPNPLPNAPPHFLLTLSGFLGFLPGGDFGPDTPFFDLREGMFTGAEPDPAYALPAALARPMHALLNCPLSRAHEVVIDAPGRRRLLERLLDYYRLHIDRFPAIHSHRILREVLEGYA